MAFSPLVGIFDVSDGSEVREIYQHRQGRNLFCVTSSDDAMYDEPWPKYVTLPFYHEDHGDELVVFVYLYGGQVPTYQQKLSKFILTWSSLQPKMLHSFLDFVYEEYMVEPSNSNMLRILNDTGAVRRYIGESLLVDESTVC